MKFKTGRLSNEEIAEIERMSDSGLSIAEISKKLNRAPETMDNVIRMKVIKVDQLTEQELRLVQLLKSRPFWKSVIQQFDDEELGHYQYQWAKYNIQFSTDVTHAEESQICRAIELDILIHKNL